MSERKDAKDLLWMFRHQPRSGQPGEVDFDPVDAIYILQKNTHNPYLKRAIAPEKGELDRTQAELSKLATVLTNETGYDIGPVNRNPPFAKREMKHPAPAPSTHPAYQNTEKLSGDNQKLPWLVNEFFTSILERLRKNPRNFDQVVLELLTLFHQKNVRIKIYDAYSVFEDWDDLMATLEEIRQYPSAETFDLFCSALFAYYDLVYPPEG